MRMVLRRYSHGGLLRASHEISISSDRGLFGELALTEEIRSCGIPTIESIGAIHHRLLSPSTEPIFCPLEMPQART